MRIIPINDYYLRLNYHAIQFAVLRLRRGARNVTRERNTCRVQAPGTVLWEQLAASWEDRIRDQGMVVIRGSRLVSTDARYHKFRI